MSMKKVVALFLIALVGVGCATKVEQARNNITQTWQISKVFANGQDITATYTDTYGDYRITFDRGGNFIRFDNDNLTMKDLGSSNNTEIQFIPF